MSAVLTLYVVIWLVFAMSYRDFYECSRGLASPTPKYRYWLYANNNVTFDTFAQCMDFWKKFALEYPYDWLSMKEGLLSFVCRQNLTTGHIVMFQWPDDYKQKKFANYVAKYGRFPNVPRL